MPIERRIREGAERNAGVLDPDVDRFLESVVRTTHRRRIIRRSLSAAAAVAAVVLVIVVGPNVLDSVGGATGGSVPGSRPNPSVAPSLTPVAPLVTGTFTRSIPQGTALVRANGIAGTWTISAEAGGTVRLLAPSSFTGAHASHAFQMQPGTLATDAFGSDICAGLSAGTYRWSVQGRFLLFTVISDPCDARVFVLGARPWTIAP